MDLRTAVWARQWNGANGSVISLKNNEQGGQVWTRTTMGVAALILTTE
jgi:hypothetical protein